MANIKLPIIELTAELIPGITENADNYQINPSCILSYMNIRGIGRTSVNHVVRDFNAIPYLAYWDIFKNYYANKQETNAYVIHRDNKKFNQTITTLKIGGETVPEDVAGNPIYVTGAENIEITYTGGNRPKDWQILITTETGTYGLDEIAAIIDDTGTVATYTWKYSLTGNQTVKYWKYGTNGVGTKTAPALQSFPLSTLDNMREKILTQTMTGGAFSVNDNAQVGSPYWYLLNWNGNNNPYVMNQQGLAVKTYQSDLFNNWLSTEWIDGAGGINEITAIDTSTGSFTLDTLNLSKKVYEMLNRIAVSGGTYDDWLDAVYTHDRYTRTETPVYVGGLSKELVFQQIVSNSAAISDTPQPLGTLAGRGTMTGKHKGGKISVRIDEPSYLIGIISLTPRLDYSQGNKWDTQLLTMDDLHKPALDEIGFQELITENMAWFGTEWNSVQNKWETKSAGKQPAWINYMTNVNQVRGNFAVKDNEMFMVLNRNYEFSATNGIQDLTTYIDPIKFNQIFANTSIDAQNFWTQISVDITARRKMSAKVMPNL